MALQPCNPITFEKYPALRAINGARRRYVRVMIEYVSGTISVLTPTEAVVEAHGVGYLCNISLTTFAAIQNEAEKEATVRLWVHESIREDAYELFGFSTRDERMLFRALIGVSGIGGMTARMVLSAFTPAELATVIQNEDVRALKSVKGVGPKAAARIVVDLRDKAFELATPSASSGGGKSPATPKNPAVEEAVAALTMLGFPPAPSQKAVIAIHEQMPEATAQDLIKGALKSLRS